LIPPRRSFHRHRRWSTTARFPTPLRQKPEPAPQVEFATRLVSP
jgi:hypothetical protein